jgi:hypothetical protein
VSEAKRWLQFSQVPEKSQLAGANLWRFYVRELLTGISISKGGSPPSVVDGPLIRPSAITAMIAKTMSKDKSVPIDPMIIPAILIPRSCCFLRNDRTPVMIAGIPVKIRNPVSDNIPSTSEAIAKPFPVSLRFGLVVIVFGSIVGLLVVIAIILTDTYPTFYEQSRLKL